MADSNSSLRSTKLSQTLGAFLYDKRLLIAITYLLFAIAQLVVSLRSEFAFNPNTFILYGLAYWFYYQKRQTLRFSNHLSAQILGGVLIILIASKLFTLYAIDANGFWAIAPPTMILGLVLLADGFHGIKQFWRLLFGIIFISGLFTRIQWSLQNNINLNIISAKFSAYLLWVTGFNAVSEGAIVYVNNGAIDIHTGCTVFPLLFACWELFIIIWLFFPKVLPNAGLALIVAFLITFPLSIIRLAIMALVVNNIASFDYWHGTDGSNIFMTTSLVGFGSFLLLKAPGDWSLNPPSSGDKTPKLPVSWFSSLVTLICIVLLTSIILLPEGGVRKFSSYQFPSVIDLPGWQLEKSEPLSLAEIGQSMTNPEAENETPLTEQEVLVYQNNQKQTNTILAGQRYFYHQLNTVVVATLKYVVNADGSFPGSRNKNFSEFDLTAFSKQRDQSLKKQDQFLLFTGDSTTHLLSCITPRGNSVVNSTALILSDRIRHTLLNPLSLYHWVRGEKLMWDRRCLWIHLKAEGQSPQTESQWQSIWELLLYYWRINFPVF